MKSKKTLLLLSLVSCASLAIVAGIGGANSGAISLVKGDETTYSITFGTNTNKLNTEGSYLSGEATVKTDQGGEIRFAYNQVENDSYSWQCLNGPGGCVYNLDPIHGLKSITFSCVNTDRPIYIYYSRDKSYDHCIKTSAATSSCTYTFEDEPNYFKIINDYIYSISFVDVKIKYTCVDDYCSIAVASADEKMGSVSSSASILRSGEEATITATPKEGYEFVGWYSDDETLVSEESSYTFTVKDEDVSLTARFAVLSYELTVKDIMTNMGTSTTSVSGTYDYGTPLTVTATPKEGYVFEGWYSDGYMVSLSNPYNFTMPAKDYRLSPRFLTQEMKEEEKKLGYLPVVDSENKIVTYGLYPQTHVSDEATIASLEALTSTNGNGWYLLNGEYYAKKEASPYHFYNYTPVFDDGTAIESGKTYWFKCELIKWRILSSSEDSAECFLLSTVLLDAHRYAENNNNYKDSEIRAWLNNEFYNTALSMGNTNLLVQTTTVDNGSSTVGFGSQFCCEDTKDNVYLPSFKDYINTDYGFLSVFSSYEGAFDPMRQCRTTDWARANGAFYCNDRGDYTYNGKYWTRSPEAVEGSTAVSIGYYEGSMFFEGAPFSGACVRPCINLKVA